MALTTNKNIMKLAEYEYCYNCKYRPPCGEGGTMEMYIPKLMGDIGLCEPKILPYVFNGDSIFGNASECKPGASDGFPYQNYIDVTLLYNNADGWEHIIDGAGKVPKGTKFLCCFINNDVDKHYFTTNL